MARFRSLDWGYQIGVSRLGLPVEAIRNERFVDGGGRNQRTKPADGTKRCPVHFTHTTLQPGPPSPRSASLTRST